MAYRRMEVFSPEKAAFKVKIFKAKEDKPQDPMPDRKPDGPAWEREIPGV